MADVVKVAEGSLHSINVAHSEVWNAVFFEEGLNTLADFRVTELRHGREKVVLDLEVEVRHPPVNPSESTRIDVHGVASGVDYP